MRRLTATAAVALAAVALAASGRTATAATTSPKPVVRVTGMHLVHMQLPRTHLPHLTPHAVVSSGNWSGYAAVAKSGVRLRFVSVDFTIPSVNCA